VVVDKKKIIFIGFVFVILLAIGITIYAIMRKRKVDKKVHIISAAIDQGVGELGTDIDSVLLNTVAANYALPASDLKKLKDAKGSWYSIDHPEYINQVLAGKTKAQDKAIINQFQVKYGIKFNDHLNDIFSDTTGYDTAGYNSVLNLVRNAK
jgi:ABC-type Zn2+ transport system substrate-binding protein/surface adhesin